MITHAAVPAYLWLALSVAILVAGLLSGRKLDPRHPLTSFVAGLLVGLLLATTAGRAVARPSADLPDGAWQRPEPAQPRTAAPSVAPRVPSPAPTGTRSAALGTAPDRQPSGTQLALRGVASWYAATGRVAAAGPALRRALGKDWRGATLRVCAAPGDSCVVVVVSDWMRRDRLIDLSDDAFARLAPLSAGVVRVRISVAPAMPETDTVQ